MHILLMWAIIVSNLIFAMPVFGHKSIISCDDHYISSRLAQLEEKHSVSSSGLVPAVLQLSFLR